MILSTFGIGFGIMTVFIIVVGCVLYYSINQKIKSVSQTDISKIDRGHFHQSFTLPTSLDNDIRKKLITYLDSHQAKIIKGSNNEIIAYLNNPKRSFSKSVKVDWKLLPIRVVISEQESDLYIQLDESHDLKKQAPEVAENHAKKYQQLFTYHIDQITETIKAT